MAFNGEMGIFKIIDEKGSLEFIILKGQLIYKGM